MYAIVHSLCILNAECILRYMDWMYHERRVRCANKRKSMKVLTLFYAKLFVYLLLF